MSSNLEKANTKRIKKFLALFNGKILTAFISGTVITTLVQSSTAVTVITVSLVNSGLIKLPQAIGIIYGSNIGTTITAQLMSFKITDACYIIVVIGLLLKFIPFKYSIKYIGSIILGLGLMFLGLNILNSGVPFIKESQTALELFRNYGQYPLSALIIGVLATMLVQSSSATIGLTIVLFNAGLINFDTALCFTLGDNIGTCITAQLASLGTVISARRTAWAHTIYNVIGVVIVLVFFSPFSFLVRYITFLIGQNETRLLANAHTIFNVLSALIFLPVTNYYVRFIEWAIKK